MYKEKKWWTLWIISNAGMILVDNYAVKVYTKYHSWFLWMGCTYKYNHMPVLQIEDVWSSITVVNFKISKYFCIEKAWIKYKL